ASQLNVLYGLLLDAALTLHIADYGNHRIQRWDYGASCDVKVAGTGALGNISLSNLNFPCAIVVDLNGHMYIVDSGNSTLVWTFCHRILNNSALLLKAIQCVAKLKSSLLHVFRNEP
ncbi:unnamed protein product, partial [Rotaria socialis]